MFIWRNLDPQILAQLLVQASVLRKARNVAAHKPRKGGTAAGRLAGKREARHEKASDV